jgi:hypothetical protein
MPSYREQIWHFLVKEWRMGVLCIAPNGQTDNEDWAVRMALANPRPAQVLNCWTNETIFRNY